MGKSLNCEDPSFLPTTSLIDALEGEKAGLRVISLGGVGELLLASTGDLAF
jgi:hypothetical protein